MIFIALGTALRLSVPLVYAGIGGYFSERAGVINIALEGLLLIGAFASATVTYLTGNPFLGIFAGCFASILLSSVHAYLCINLKSDPIISGIAINTLALGLPPVICQAVFDMSGGTPMLEDSVRLPKIFGVSPIGIGAVFLVFFVGWIHRSTVFGQHIRFAGEHPEALESQGISVKKVRWIALILTGAICGLAGSYLSIDHGSGFSRSMSAGRGFIALAALILGKWQPFPTAIAALAFGAMEATQILMQGIRLGDTGSVPVEWVQIFPYVLTLITISFFMRSKR